MVADIDTHIENCQQILNRTPEDDPSYESKLKDLLAGHEERYRRQKDISDLNTALRIYQDILVANVNRSDRSRAFFLYNLGCKYGERYRRQGNTEDFTRSRELSEEALFLTPKDVPERIDQLQDLGMLYHFRCRRTGDEKALDKAMEIHRKAVEEAPQGLLDRGQLFHNIGLGYQTRYDRIGSIADLTAAIEQYREAVKLTPKFLPQRLFRVHNLALALRDRYMRLSVEKDIEDAAELLEEASELIPADPEAERSRLKQLGLVYFTKSTRSHKKKDDLEIAIEIWEEALTMVSEGDSEHVCLLYYLGNAHYARFRWMRDPHDLDMAIQKAQQAYDLTKDVHPDQVNQLFLIGRAYEENYQLTMEVSSLKRAIQQYDAVLKHSSYRIPVRLGAANHLMEIHANHGDLLLAYETACVAMSLIPLLTPRFLGNSDKQHLLQETLGLASDAAAIALMVGKSPFEAIRLLELGRGVIAGSLNELRTDISALEIVHPELAEEYNRLRDLIDIPSEVTPQSGILGNMTEQADERYRASEKLNQLIEKIRELPGHSRFLLAPTEDELKASAIRGPIVILNVSPYRCDALIIQRHQIRFLLLPQLRESDIESRSSAIGVGSIDLQTLEWLWDTIGQPILDTLGFTHVPRGRSPRIWWVPTGVLTKYPIHAAGYHVSGVDTVMDRVISSYSLSARALIQSRQTQTEATSETEIGQAVLVGMPDTPGQMHLDFASKEIEKLRGICHAMQLQVSQPQSDRDSVLSALKDCILFHFAGHGRASAFNPAESGLLLHDGMLTVESLYKINIRRQKPFFAYLSACGTGQIKDDKLIDEGLHLIAACQLAGFRHVIGTLWQVSDELCAEAAIQTYDWIRQKGIRDETICEGLHRACKSLRDEWVWEYMSAGSSELHPGKKRQRTGGRGVHVPSQAPRDIKECDEVSIRWAPYVHFGP